MRVKERDSRVEKKREGEKNVGTLKAIVKERLLWSSFLLNRNMRYTEREREREKEREKERDKEEKEWEKKIYW